MTTFPNVLYVKFNSRRKFGVELELNKKLPLKEIARIVKETDPTKEVLVSNEYAHSNNNPYWHCKFDRSCGDVEGDGGWEVASYVAKGYKDISVISKMGKALKDAGAQVNEHCALHIHGEMSDFKTVDQVSALVANWMKIENIVCEMVPKHRRNNKYCKLLSKKYEVDISKAYNAAAFWAAVRPRDAGNPNRRVALNMCNYATGARRTVELRLPEGTLEAKDIKNWIRFFLRFIDTAKKSPFPDSLAAVELPEAMQLMGLHSEAPFFILSKALREAKVWALKRILKFSTKKDVVEDATHMLEMLELPKETIKPEANPYGHWWQAPNAFRE